MGGSIERTDLNVSTENNETNLTSPAVLKSKPAQNQIKETKEQTKKLDKEIQSKRYLENSELKFKESVKIVSDILKVPAVYNEKFISVLKDKQKKLGLKPDGILGDKTLGMILIGNTENLNIELSTDKEIIAFNDAIKDGTVTEKMLKNIGDRIPKLLSEKPKRNKSGNYTSDSFFGKDMTNNLIARKLFTDFKLSEKGKDSKFDSVYKEIEEEELKTTQTLVKNSISIMGNLTPEQKKAFTKATQNTNMSSGEKFVLPEGVDPKSVEGIALEAASKIRENPLLMATAFIGFIMFIFGKRDGFAKGGFFGLLAVVGGPSLIKTGKDLLGLVPDIPKVDPKKVEEIKKTLTKVSETTKEKITSAGGSITGYMDNLFNKNKGVVDTAMSENPQLNRDKLTTIVGELGGNDKFKDIEIDKLEGLKFNSLDTSTQKILTDKGITKDSKEFTAYIKILKDKIVEVNSKNPKSIKTVGDYFESGISNETIGVVAGSGLVLGGIITKSPVMFGLGAGAVTESIWHPIQNFFEKGKGKSSYEKARKIFETNDILLKKYIDNRELDSKLVETINKLISANEFTKIRDLTADNRYSTEIKNKIKEISNYAEKLYYTSEVESRTGENSYIPSMIESIYNYGKDKATELTNSFDERKKGINDTIGVLKGFKDKIKDTNIPNKSLLIAELRAEIADAEAQINSIEVKKQQSKIEKVEDLKKEILELNKEIDKLGKENLALDNSKLDENATIENNKAKIERKKAKILKLSAELTIAKKGVDQAKQERKETKTNNFEESLPKKKDELKTLITEIQKIKEIKTVKDAEKLHKLIKKVESLRKEAKEVGKESELNFTEFDTKSKELKGNVKIKLSNIIKSLTLENYESSKVEDYLEILKELDIVSNDFYTNLKTKKKEIFEARISGASIEEIGILREKFGTVAGSAKQIKERLEFLAENTLAKDDEEIKKLIDNIKDESIIDEAFNKNNLENKSIIELYKYIYQSSNPSLKTLVNRLKNKYEIVIEKSKTKKEETNSTKSENKSEDVTVEIIEPKKQNEEKSFKVVTGRFN